ncbi:histone H2A, sperm-like [Maniola jurtina]|uniref:histone H2A, sperm-like n=1 Tax=Maniola jurtina TaxID=191418 RepID=UPI001E68D82C|nr:histone H2A, sperm-like [Maniola jurtina]XP_045764956.1 histone H2A, sperm-like [Maniola jurtina]
MPAHDITAKNKTKSKTKSKRAGLTFPVGRVYRILRKGKYAPRVGCGSAVYMTAVLEYLSAEILELAAKAATDNGRSRILPRHIMLAVANDDELDKMLRGVTIPQGGVMPKIHTQLLPKKTKNSSKAQTIGSSKVLSQEY